MLILHHLNWWQSNGFGILLILVDKIKRDIAQTWEGLQPTAGRVEITNKLIRKRNLERITIRIKNERREDNEKHQDEL